jgi:hypothetical protein
MPALKIPLVCENPECRAVFMRRHFMSTPVGTTVMLSNIRIGPCPKCGKGFGLAPSGEYLNAGDVTLFAPRSTKDREFLERALRFVQTAFETDQAIEQFQKEATATLPELSALWRLMPSNRTEAYQFWLMVIALLTVLLMAYSNTQKPAPMELMAPKNLIDAIQNARPDSPSEIRKPPPSPPPKERGLQL